MALFAKHHVLGNLLLSQSRETMALFDEAVIAAQNDLITRLKDPSLQIHPRIYLRWSHLPPFTEVHRSTMPKSVDANKLLMVRGTVVRAALPNLIEWEVVYQCQSCHGHFTRHADLESYNNHPYPTSCGAPTPSNGKKCTSKKFAKVSSVTAYNSRDYQELKLQEQVQHLDMGAMPRSIAVVVLDNLVGLCSAGDDVTVTGLVTRRWGELSFGVKPEVELIILATHITLNNERKSSASTSGKGDEVSKEFLQFWQDNMDCPLMARNAIIRSICPDIYGLYYVKLALAMVLAGGVRTVSAGTAVRGDSHLLMIGDPGTGKSQLLRFAAKMATRSVLTTGVGTTGAGLTAAAARDQRGEWGLEAGALVLADGGSCCIDEFASIQKEDQTSIHEAMEQQTLHIAKAGNLCQLHTRCSIIAATNPKSKYNVDESVSMNVALGGALLSRFDLVLILLDEPDDYWDKAISSFILGERTKSRNKIDYDDEEVDGENGMDVDSEDALINMFQNGAFDEDRRRNRASSSSITRNRGSNGMADQSFGAPVSPSTPGGPPRSTGGSPSSHSHMDLDLNGARDMSAAGSVTASSQTLGLEQSALFSRSNGVRTGSLLHDIWPLEKLQSYFHWIKSTFKPLLSPEVTIIGQKYYSRQRQADTPDQARTTARLADAFVRVTQGHAKLMGRHVAVVQDAIFTIVLLESSTFTSNIGHQRFPTVRSFFPADPDAEYPKLEALILESLGLQHLATHHHAPPSNGGNNTSTHSHDAPAHLGHTATETLNISAANINRGPRPFSGYNSSQANYPDLLLLQRLNSRQEEGDLRRGVNDQVQREPPPKTVQSIPLVFEDPSASQASNWGKQFRNSQIHQDNSIRYPSSTTPTQSYHEENHMAPNHHSSQMQTFSTHSQSSPSAILHPESATADLIPLPLD